MRKDLETQKNVLEELRNTPTINANEIGIAVKQGIVTLSGTVDSYSKKVRVEKAVRNVSGVRGIAEDIRVKIADGNLKDDSEIARVVLHAIEWHSAAQVDKISILVEDGWVTLEGASEWDFQRKSAAKAVGNIAGVKGITNNIKLSARPATSDIKNKIQSAFLRNASLDADKITVEVSGTRIILNGTVNSWTEFEEAERSAWNTPGVSAVENKLELDSEY
ncbi:MAG: BON domain-containing protein [Bacteroidia bacterium]